jgi:hypothetical protein
VKGTVVRVTSGVRAQGGYELEARRSHSDKSRRRRIEKREPRTVGRLLGLSNTGA